MPSNQEQPTEMSRPPPPYDRSRSIKRRTSGCGRGDRAAKLGISDSVTDRLTRVGVTTQKIEDFSAWEGAISGLTSITSHNEAHLAKIAAAEKAGLIVLTSLIGELRQRNQQKRATGTLTTNLAA